MPKVIDHERRATDIAEAAWRVLVDRGMGAVSVRNVAQEAGLATASLRRVFPTQADLLVACIRLMSDRVAARIEALPPRRPAVDRALAALAETLPLDDVRRTEMEVYLAFSVAALSDPALREPVARVLDELSALGAVVVDGLAPGLTPAVRRREVLALVALVDGLALRLLHGAAGRDATAALRSHLLALADRGNR